MGQSKILRAKWRIMFANSFHYFYYSSFWIKDFREMHKNDIVVCILIAFHVKIFIEIWSSSSIRKPVGSKRRRFGIRGGSLFHFGTRHSLSSLWNLIFNECLQTFYKNKYFYFMILQTRQNSQQFRERILNLIKVISRRASLLF